MNLIRVTNASTGKMSTINPAAISSIQDRNDPKWPRTNAAIVMNDNKNSFIPTVETEEEIWAKIDAVSPRMPSQRREDPPVNTDER